MNEATDDPISRWIGCRQEPSRALERLMVCISSHPLCERLVQAGHRLAVDLDAEWFDVYIGTPINQVRQVFDGSSWSVC